MKVQHPINWTSQERPCDERGMTRCLPDLFAGADASSGCEDAVVERLLGFMHGLDPAVRRHGERTAGYAVALGTTLGFSDGTLRQLRWAALLHDIGTLTLPESVVRKDGCLSGEEYALLQSHPRAGAELLEPFPFLRPAAIWIALHHERWDGCGYPYGLRGAYIPFGSRILAVADAFDALSGPGRSEKPLPYELAARILAAGAGTQFDPDVVEVFAAISLQTP